MRRVLTNYYPLKRSVLLGLFFLLRLTQSSHNARMNERPGVQRLTARCVLIVVWFEELYVQSVLKYSLHATCAL